MNGRIAALNRFVPRAAERCLPFFKVLCNSKGYSWGNEQSKVFTDLKQYLANMINISPPKPGAQLLLHITTSNLVVNVAIVQEQNTEGQAKKMPVYFVSEAL